MTAKTTIHEALRCPKCGHRGTPYWRDADLFDDGTGFIVMECMNNGGVFRCRRRWIVDITGVAMSEDIDPPHESKLPRAGQDIDRI